MKSTSCTHKLDVIHNIQHHNNIPTRQEMIRTHSMPVFCCLLPDGLSVDLPKPCGSPLCVNSLSSSFPRVNSRNSKKANTLIPRTSVATTHDTAEIYHFCRFSRSRVSEFSLRGGSYCPTGRATQLLMTSCGGAQYYIY